MGLLKVATEYGALLYRMFDAHVYREYAGLLMDIYTYYLHDEPVRLSIPLEVTRHDGWGMYDQFDKLEALTAHPDSPVYETIDGVLYHKKWNELLYVPRAKDTLHIPAKITGIGYNAFRGRRLTEVTVAQDHPTLRTADGILYNRELTKLYYLPYPERTLHIPKSVVWVNKDVLLRKPDCIIVEQGNPVFKTTHDFLMQNGKIRCVLSSVTVLLLPENPVFTDNFEIPPQITEVICPDHMTAFPKQLIGNGWKLQKISVPADIIIPKKAFRKSAETIFHIRRKDGMELVIPSCGRSLRFYLHLLRSADFGIKPDLALFWLHVYLSGWTHDPALCRNLRRSFFMIGRILIDADDTAQMQAVLEDGALLSDKHRRQLLGYARECGSPEMTDILDAYNVERNTL